MLQRQVKNAIKTTIFLILTVCWAVMPVRILCGETLSVSPQKITPAKTFMASIFARKLSKSEYETDVQYRARLAKLRPSGEHYLSTDTRLLTYKYDAETQGLVITALAQGDDNKEFFVGSTTVSRFSDVEQNAFGVTAKVTHERERFYTLALQGDLPGKGLLWKTGDQSIYGTTRSIGIGLACLLNPELAKQQTKAKEYTLVFGVHVGDLTKAKTDRFGDPATLTVPVGVLTDTYTLPVYLDSIFLMHVPTKTVVAICPRPASLAPR